MKVHTIEIRPGLLQIRDDVANREIGMIVQGTSGDCWLIEITDGAVVRTFKDYTSCLAFLDGYLASQPIPAHFPIEVHVTANDYSYDGWIVARFPKRKSGQIRYVVEDENGRLFIHNEQQLKVGNDET
jgi:hypothetical protein